jgi:glycosyltransferase involved in cell wall biosynthesis
MANTIEADATAISATRPSREPPRIGVLVVAYNAESTLASVLDRVPKSFRPRISQVFICDDASADSTYLVGLGYKQTSDDMPLTVIRHPRNLGYGGNQKAGYRMAIDAGLDIIVMLHGDGQYAPECLPEIVAPLIAGEADAVFGSRMMEPGSARQGGMPLYKYVGNRILTTFENKMLGTSLSEFHSGYRAYSVEALKKIQFERNSDNFNFDTQIIIQLVDAGLRIVEVPIPTHYGDEICYVNGFKYARDVSGDVAKHRLERLGFGAGDFGAADATSDRFESDEARSIMSRWLEHRPPSRVLALGAAGVGLAQTARQAGHDVTIVVPPAQAASAPRSGDVILADIDSGIPDEVKQAGRFDVVLCAATLEVIREPEKLLADVRSLLAPGGVLIGSAPNFGHWYPRLRTLFGLFDYDQRGVLSSAHVRFFTRRGLRYRFRASGLKVAHEEIVGSPIATLYHGRPRMARLLRLLDRLLVSVRPEIFGYQMVFMCEPVAPSAPPAEAEGLADV